jgi:hypothetical protein
LHSNPRHRQSDTKYDDADGAEEKAERFAGERFNHVALLTGAISDPEGHITY